VHSSYVYFDGDRWWDEKERRGWGGTDADQSIDQISLAFFYVYVSVFVVCSFLIVQTDECAAARQISSIDIIRKFLGGENKEGVLWLAAIILCIQAKEINLFSPCCFSSFTLHWLDIVFIFI
jgi:hypothetical protein